MKPITFSLLLLAALPAGAQQKPAAVKKIDMATVIDLSQHKADYKTITTELGQPTEEEFNEKGAWLRYVRDDKIYRFKLGPDRKMQNFEYWCDGKGDSSQLLYANVKRCRKLNSADEVNAAFGEPESVSINDSSMAWRYRYKTRGLSIYFEMPTKKIKKYAYDERNDTRNMVVVPEMTENLQKGAFNTDEIRERLGAPSAITMDDHSEHWMYNSKNTMLILYFDQQSKLDRYNYSRRSE
jgi:hypothetical protein